jgi:hypothetical protein
MFASLAPWANQVIPEQLASGHVRHWIYSIYRLAQMSRRGKTADSAQELLLCMVSPVGGLYVSI